MDGAKRPKSITPSEKPPDCGFVLVELIQSPLSLS